MLVGTKRIGEVGWLAKWIVDLLDTFVSLSDNTSNLSGNNVNLSYNNVNLSENYVDQEEGYVFLITSTETVDLSIV